MCNCDCNALYSLSDYHFPTGIFRVNFCYLLPLNVKTRFAFNFDAKLIQFMNIFFKKRENVSLYFALYFVTTFDNNKCKS